ncbi:MAG: hypothetical protein OXE52_12260 [Chloroflexi bacterium]|nr:hypothetical protein [Chloroflexota bacterium]
MDIKSLVDSIRDLFFGEDSWSLKAANISIVLAMIALTVFALESAMGLITIGRLERKVNLLKELNAIADTGVGNLDSHLVLDSVFDDSLNSLKQYRAFDLIAWIHGVLDDNQEYIRNITPGATAWILLALIAPFVMKDGCLVRALVTILLLVIAVVVGFILALVFSFGDSGTNAILRLIGSFISIWLLIKFSNQRTQKQAAESSAVNQSQN